MTRIKRRVGLHGLNQRWLLAITVFLTGSLVSSAAGAISWTPHPVLANFHDVIFDGNQFWAVGDNGLVQVSPDGATWTSAAPGPSYNFYGIAHGGGGQYVVVGAGSGGTNVDYSVYVTNNGGLTWSQATVSSTSFNVTFFSVAHGATAGEYVAVGGGGVIRRSTDGGATWSPSPQYWYYYWLSKVIYAPIGTGLYVAVGDAGSILTSNDGGVTWTAQYAPGTVFLPIGNGMNLYDVAYANGLLVAVGWDNSTSSGVILTSPDGINWTRVTPNPTAEPLHGVTHGPCGWVAVGANGTVLISPNGTSWTAETSNTTAVLRRVAYGAGRYVAVGQGAILVGLCADGSPDLAVSKTVDGSLVAGQPGSYQIVVSNVGVTPVSGPVVVTDTLGPGLNFVSATGTGWTCTASGPTVTCVHPGPVPPSGSLPSITLTVQVGGDAQEIQNCAKVTRADVKQPPTAEVPHWVYTPIPDVNPYNDEACVIAPVEGKKAEICIFKFHDLDGDGKHDPNEPGLPGWPFTVSPAPLPPTMSPVTTGPQGIICFGVTAPGTYTITEIVQPGWTSTTPSTQTVTITPGQLVHVLFGNKKAEGTADLGDAPDSTNHINKPMTAYTGVLAKFPTVFDPATGLPQGPKHLQPKGLAWLGKDVSFEDEADLLPDADGVTNIDPGANVADRDKYDDGVLLPIAIPFVCGQTQFQYTVTSTAAAKLYVNVWIDFNRDGDWDDPIQKCPLGPATTGSFTEWAVQNELITVPGPGTYTFTTPPFGAANLTKGSEMWMRITLTDQPIAPVHGADGSGPTTGYKYGETEDYLLRLEYGEICGVKFHDLNGNGKQDPGEPGLSDWVIEVKDAHGNIMGYAVTDANGKYCIVVPSPGTYTITEQVQPGWTPTTPTTQTVTVAPGQTVGVLFGNREAPVGRCDLAIRKDVRPNPVPSGGQVTVTLTVSNVGTAPCAGPTTLTETIPTGLSLVSVSGTGWTCLAILGNVICTYPGTIPAGGSTSITLVFTVTAKHGTRIENCATLSNANDTNPANNRDCAVITVTEKR